MYAQQERPFDPTRIPQAISDAGFTSTEILVTMDGTLSLGREFLELHVACLKQPFVLSGGPQYSTLQKREDVAGKKIRLTGKLRPLHGTEPPGLTVDKFALQP